MKTIMNVLLAPFKLIKWIITFILDVISVIILGIGSIIYALNFFIKDFKGAKKVLTTLIKKIIENG